MTSIKAWSSEGLSQDSPNIKKQLVVHLASQTGDTTHVAAAAALDSLTDILVISHKDNEETGVNDLMKFHQRAVGEQGAVNEDKGSSSHTRVFRIRVGSEGSATGLYALLTSNPAGSTNSGVRYDISKWVDKPETPSAAAIQKLSKDPEDQDQTPIEKKVRKIFFPNDKDNDKDKEGPVYLSLGVYASTYIIKEKFAAMITNKGSDSPLYKQEKLKGCYKFLTERLAIKLESPIFKDGKLEFANKKLPVFDPLRPVLLLWARYTGGNKPNGYNPEGDSDTLGQLQLVQMAQEKGLNFQVITIGHDPDPSRKIPLYQDHYNFSLGEFYLIPPIKGTGREGQLSFMLELMQAYPGNLYQMGQKTGGMDAGAMVGIPTLYIEDKGSPTKDRLKSWTESVPFYSCALIQEPPTLLGRALRLLKSLPETANVKAANESERRAAMVFYLRETSHEDQRNWKDTLESMKKPAFKSAADFEVQGFVPGYTLDDLNTIKSQLEKLSTAYNAGSAIIRNRKGEYVRREDFARK